MMEHSALFPFLRILRLRRSLLAVRSVLELNIVQGMCFTSLSHWGIASLSVENLVSAFDNFFSRQIFFKF